MKIGPSALHEVVGAFSELAFNIFLIFFVVWMYRTGHLQNIWNDITELSVFGTSLKKRTAQEAANLDDVALSGESGVTEGKFVIWATSGRRPVDTINALIGKGYLIREIDPLSSGDLESVASLVPDDKEPVIVTNLRHDTSNSGGQAFSERVREKYPNAHIVVFTSRAAKNRRGSHIANDVRTSLVATNEPELDNIFLGLFD